MSTLGARQGFEKLIMVFTRSKYKKIRKISKVFVELMTFRIVC